MPELIKQCHVLPPHPCEYDSGAATPGVERRKLALKIDKLLADLGQIVPGQGAALHRVRLARGRRLVRGLPTGDQIEEFFTCPDGAHSVLHIARKNVQVWHCGEYGECGECGHKKFSKRRKKARHGAGRHWLSDQYSTIGERRKEVRTLPEAKGAASAEREGS